MSLSRLPHRCPYAPENGQRGYPVRVLRVDRCLFSYTVDEAAKTVRVIAFRHGSQLPSGD